MMDFAKIITLFVCSFLQATFGFPNSGHLASERSVTLYSPTGTISSDGYPSGYTSDASESWKLRVPGASSYTITFLDMDLDEGGCSDYIVLYDDSDYTASGRTFCTMPSGPVVMYTGKMTISFVASSSIFIGKRGAGFSLSYVAEGNGISTTSTISSPTTTTEGIVITSSPTATVTTTVSPNSSATTKFPDASSATSTAQTSSTSTDAGTSEGNFPAGTQDDSGCGVPATKPYITGFDYEAQGEQVSYKDISTRVVNGEEAVPHSWPWQVSLQGSYGSAYCGGTLIRDQWVVTAAHCADLIFIGTYGSDQVALGMHDKRMEAGVQKIDIVAKYVHPQYDTPDRSHDVALVKMKTKAVLNKDVSLACEAHQDWVFPAGMYCVVTGWGVTTEGGNVGTNILQQAPLPLLSDTACYALYQQANLDTTDDMQCAGGQGKGACNGDSGGPLNCYVNDRWYHMGIVSFGEANCDTDIAGVFARVSKLRSFIDEIIEKFS